MEKIRALQLTETEMLKQFDAVCRKHNIPYFAFWGTALGAVRHQGFIPWDDDVDVGMMRSDYEKLKHLPEQEWNGLLLIDGETEDCFYHEKVFPKLYKPGTVFETEFRKETIEGIENNKRPVWIDIFLFDYVDNEHEALKKAKKAIYMHRKYYYAKYRMKINSKDGIKTKLSKRIKNFLHLIYSKSTPQSIMHSYYRKIKKDSGTSIISYDSWIMKDIINSMCHYNDIYPTHNMTFEDFEIMVPNSIEKLLRKWYGDYMQLPPENQRGGHEASELIL